MTSPSDVDLLQQARAKAQALLDRLLEQQADLDRSPPQLPPDQLAQGQQAFDQAVDAAKRTLENINQALEVATH
jgi:hypothetical protein